MKANLSHPSLLTTGTRLRVGLQYLFNVRARKISNARPAVPPTTAPAIPPLESPLSLLLAGAVLQAVADGAQELNAGSAVSVVFAEFVVRDAVVEAVPAKLAVIEPDGFSVQCWPGLSPPAILTFSDVLSTFRLISGPEKSFVILMEPSFHSENPQYCPVLFSTLTKWTVIVCSGL